MEHNKVSKEEHIPIKVSVFKVILSKVEPIKNKVSSLLEDHYKSINRFPERDLIVLSELQVSCSILCNFLMELLEQAHEAGALELNLLSEEVTLLSTLATAIESASAHGIANTNLLEH